MKKIPFFSIILLSLLVIFNACKKSVFKDVEYEGIIEYKDINYRFINDYAEVKSCSEKCSGKLTLPDSIFYHGYWHSVKSIGDGAFYGCSSLKSIHIPEGVKSIGDRAFRDCTGLTSVNIPKSVENIGYRAFAGCI